MDLWEMMGITRQTGLFLVGGGLVLAVVLGFVVRARAGRAESHRGFDLGNH